MDPEPSSLNLLIVKCIIHHSAQDSSCDLSSKGSIWVRNDCYRDRLRIKTYFLADTTYFLFPSWSLAHIPSYTFHCHIFLVLQIICVWVCIHTHKILYECGKYISVICPLFHICDNLDNRPSKMNNTEEFNGSSLWIWMSACQWRFYPHPPHFNSCGHFWAEFWYNLKKSWLLLM